MKKHKCEKHKCECSAVESLEFCDHTQETQTTTTTPIQDTKIMMETDQFLIVRQSEIGARQVYLANIQDLTADSSLLLLEKAVQVMPRVDPADGQSLWLDEGFVRMASGDPSQLGVLSPTALEKSLKEAFKILPTSDPGDGSPWLCGGVLMQGSSNKTNTCC